MLKVIFLLLAVSLFGCTPTREITYNMKDVPAVHVGDDSVLVTRNVTLSIGLLEDARQTVAENGILFVRSRETDLHDKTYCINSEEHYKKDMVTQQIANTMASHLKKRGTFKSILVAMKDQTDYRLTGKLKRLYGEQELSSAARTGSYFGLIGALATAGATTDGEILIENHRSRTYTQERWQTDSSSRYQREVYRRTFRRRVLLVHLRQCE